MLDFHCQMNFLKRKYKFTSNHSTMYLFFLTISFVIINGVSAEGILFPRQSETREIMSLDGIWNFALSPMNDPLVGLREHWYKKELSEIPNVELHLMPVPSSYNDITLNATIRDHVGLVWYERKFFVPRSWRSKQRICIRFSSVSYAAQVWINGQLATSHEIGHLPFQKEISSLLKFDGLNKITVACDNTLLRDTIPQGTVNKVTTDEGQKLVQTYTFDFFNYAGIHRPVTLYTTPKTYIDDITVYTDVVGTTGVVYYNVSFINVEVVTTIAKLLDKEGKVVAHEEGYEVGILEVKEAKLWWPYLMHPKPGYLYTLQLELRSYSGETMDIYRQPVGIRIISWSNDCMCINKHPLYLHGFGRHEDADIRGKGLDFPTIIKDHNLIKWVGANSYRTSHYPYAEEIMDLADQLGIMIIDECPGADTKWYSADLFKKHKESLTQLIQRDKNRPAVIMWSVSNEPYTENMLAGMYFGEIIKHVKNLDKTRPTTIAISGNVNRDHTGKHLDVISFNRYNSWYSNTGHLDQITKKVIDEARSWHIKYKKPVIMSEYGADTMPGLHIYPEYVWSEEFQVSMMSKHFKAFDKLRAEKWFIGEFIWNFADFKTAQSYTRVGGNKKGIFTRDRQPKSGAHHLRKRYFLLAKELYNATVPKDLFEYLSPKSKVRDEL